MRSVHVFAGPTAFGVAWPVRVGPLAIEWHPPCRRGDLEALASSRRGDVVLLVDGVFHHELPPSHFELKRAMLSGLEVWGTASLGAIRACELRSLGMRGTGAIFEAYCEDPELRDDEVALLHALDAPFKPLSEPLIELREAMRAAVVDGHLAQADATAVTEELRSLWYGDRTLELFARLLGARVGPEALQLILAPQRRVSWRLKQTDLKAALRRIADG